jgi:hypothetical protein
MAQLSTLGVIATRHNFMSQSPKTEPAINKAHSSSRYTARQMYIRMLRQRIDAVDSVSSESREHVLWSGLIKSGFLDGTPVSDQFGVPSKNIVGPPTLKGRLFLQELELQEKNESSLHRIIKYSVPVVTFFMGIVSSVLIEWFKKYLGL